MLKLGNAYNRDKLLDPKTRKAFFSPEPENSPGQLGSIHDGYVCRWDAYATKDVVFLFMINVFGQTVSEPTMAIANDMRNAFVTGLG